MLPSFARMSNFALGIFFGPKIPQTIISIVTHAHPIKKVTIRLKTFTCVRCLTRFLIGVLLGVCPSMLFSYGRRMNELRK